MSNERKFYPFVLIEVHLVEWDIPSLILGILRQMRISRKELRANENPEKCALAKRYVNGMGKGVYLLVENDKP